MYNILVELSRILAPGVQRVNPFLSKPDRLYHYKPDDAYLYNIHTAVETNTSILHVAPKALHEQWFLNILSFRRWLSRKL